jgi:RNA polymerase sigma-70 factor (ECF subfamily)
MNETAAAEAMARYASGEASAFADVYKHVNGLVRSVVSRYLSDPAAVEDAVQSTFLRAHRARKTFRTDSPASAMRAWYAAMARHVALDELRRSMRAHARVDRATRETEWLAGDRTATEQPDAVFEDEQTRQEERRHLEQLLDRLPATQREVVRRHNLRGESFARMSEHLGTSRGNLRVRAHRARLALRRLFVEEQQASGDVMLGLPGSLAVGGI